MSGEVSRGALRAPGSRVSKRCPESVPGVSKRCAGHSGDTLGTPFGHSGARGGPRDTPPDTHSDTSIFGDTPSDTPREGAGDVSSFAIAMPIADPRNRKRFPRQEKAMLHCDLRVRWKVASDLRFWAANSEPKAPFFCGISGDLAPSTRKSLAIAILRFWCAKGPRNSFCFMCCLCASMHG